MRSAFVSMRFPCCPKTYLRVCGPNLLSKRLLLRREAPHEPFTGNWCEERSIVYRQRRDEESAHVSNGKIVGRAAERAGIDRHERRMRRRGMRFVFGSVGRMLVNSCLVPVGQAKGASIVTIEGLSAHAP